MNRFCLVLVLLTLILSASMFYAVDTKVSQVNEEVVKRIEVQDFELEKIKKDVRILQTDSYINVNGFEEKNK